MARIRTIKPEFWTSEQIVECSPTARLLFIGLWNFADDGGVIPASSRSIKMKIFPGDDLSIEKLNSMLGELTDNGLLLHYFVDAKEYFSVTGWHHQKIEKPTYRYPGPEKRTPPPNKGNGKTDKFDDQSPNSRRPVGESSATEGKGRDVIKDKGTNVPLSGKPNEKETESKPEAAESNIPRLKHPWQNPELTDQERWALAPLIYRAEKIIAYLNKQTGSKFYALHPGGKETETAKIIIARIKQGWYWDDFCDVIDSKTREWKGTDREIYLRPKTLFAATNFENYIGQVKR